MSPDSNTLWGWGRRLSSECSLVVPNSLGDMPNKELEIAFRGGGNSYGDASLPRIGQTAWVTTDLSKIIDFNTEKGEVTVEAGVTYQELIDRVLPAGYFPPVTPGTQFVTLGGAVASNVHGKNHHLHGSLENFILELEVINQGEIISCGPNNNPEFFRATVGGYGLTGFISKIRLTLIPVSSPLIFQESRIGSNLEEVFGVLKEHRENFPYSVAWVDTTAPPAKIGRGHILLGRHANEAEIPATPHNWREKSPYPSFKFPILRPSTIPWFNRGLFLSGKNATSFLHLKDYFYPLDRVPKWNSLYGSGGLVQYQATLPDPHGEEAVEEILQTVQSKKLRSFVTVLKRCGADNVLLPFCKTGYTLAMDFPGTTPGLEKSLNLLDEIVLKYRGKVYLTKDSRLSSTTFRAMYPEFEKWMKTILKYNPDKRYNSQLAERLEFWQRLH